MTVQNNEIPTWVLPIRETQHAATSQYDLFHQQANIAAFPAIPCPPGQYNQNDARPRYPGHPGNRGHLDPNR